MNISKFNIAFRIILITAFAAFAGCGRVKIWTDEMTDEKVVRIRTFAKGWISFDRLYIKFTASPKNETAADFKNMEISLMDESVFTAETTEVRVRFDKGNPIVFTCKKDRFDPGIIYFDNPETFFRQCVNASTMIAQYENGFGIVKTLKFDISDLPIMIYEAGIRSIGYPSLEVASN